MPLNTFTPLAADKTTRLSFDPADIEVLDGDLHARGLGKHATVKIDGALFEVFGENCGLRNCNCDAVLKRVA